MADSRTNEDVKISVGGRRGGRCSSTHLEILRLAIPSGGRLGYDDVLCCGKKKKRPDDERAERKAGTRRERRGRREKNTDEQRLCSSTGDVEQTSVSRRQVSGLLEGGQMVKS